MRRDRVVTVMALVIITLLSWAYLASLAADMDMSMDAAVEGGAMAPSPEGSSMAGMAPALQPWSMADAVAMFVMWAVMMVAMMLPSAGPMILLHAKVSRTQTPGAGTPVATAAFTLGYLLAWTGFSAVATALQWGLERLSLLSPMMVSTSDLLGGVLLLAAGVYQLTPLKEACLHHCRSPVAFVMAHWRTGVRGALVMGLDHGVYCIGCCWLLMLLLFVGGVMNLTWIAGLAVLVLLEKVLPRGRLVARLSSAGLLIGGGWLLLG